MLYLPPHFEETDPAAIAGLIAQRPLGTLITLGADGLSANHTPFLLDERSGDRGTLIGHVARNNAVWHDFDREVEALVVFQGPSAYISPNWYATKQETHEVVPTYNYAVVHAYGNIIIHEDEKWLRGIVGKLTKAMEASQPVPWKMADAPPDYLKMMLGNIVGIEIPITRLIGKWKTSQNRVDADRLGAAQALNALGDDESMAMAELILAERNS
jgi:transcriptional regulator